MTKQEQEKKHLPDFSKMSKEEEAHWWESHDTADYLRELKEVQVEFGPEALNPAPKTRGIHVRLKPGTLIQLRAIAGSKGLGATTLARMWILEKLELSGKKAAQSRA